MCTKTVDYILIEHATIVCCVFCGPWRPCIHLLLSLSDSSTVCCVWSAGLSIVWNRSNRVDRLLGFSRKTCVYQARSVVRWIPQAMSCVVPAQQSYFTVLWLPWLLSTGVHICTFRSLKNVVIGWTGHDLILIVVSVEVKCNSYSFNQVISTLHHYISCSTKYRSTHEYFSNPHVNIEVSQQSPTIRIKAVLSGKDIQRSLHWGSSAHILMMLPMEQAATSPIHSCLPHPN